MIYNPLYTPEFNPIELIFNKLKTEFKKLNHKNLIDDIKQCLKFHKNVYIFIKLKIFL